MKQNDEAKDKQHENDENFDPAFDIIGGDGVVSISLGSGRKIAMDFFIYPENFYNYQFQNLRLFVRNGNFCRSFKPSSYDNGYPCWNQKLNIPVHVYPTRNHPYNSLVFTMEIFNIFPMGVETEDEPRKVIGSLILHLYDIIPLNEIEDSFYFYQKTRLGNAIGCVSMTLKFMYGAFGYGYSMQINEQLLQTKSENKNILFPRIIPRSFGKDFIYIGDNSRDIIEENKFMVEQFSKQIEYLFNLKRPEEAKVAAENNQNQNQNQNKESRKSRLDRLKNLVLTEHSDTASINLDDKTFLRSEQTKMLKQHLIQKEKNYE